MLWHRRRLPELLLLTVLVGPGASAPGPASQRPGGAKAPAQDGCASPLDLATLGDRGALSLDLDQVSDRSGLPGIRGEQGPWPPVLRRLRRGGRGTGPRARGAQAAGSRCGGPGVRRMRAADRATARGVPVRRLARDGSAARLRCRYRVRGMAGSGHGLPLLRGFRDTRKRLAGGTQPGTGRPGRCRGAGRSGLRRHHRRSRPDDRDRARVRRTRHRARRTRGALFAGYGHRRVARHHAHRHPTGETPCPS